MILKTIFSTLMLCSIFSLNCFANNYSEEKVFSVLRQINPSIVYGTLTKRTGFYEKDSLKAHTFGQHYENDVVEILEDKTSLWYYVKDIETDEIGWIPKDCLNIPPDTHANKTEMSTDDIETYINMLSFDSKTNNLIWVDIDRQKVHIFRGEKGNRRLKKTLLCSTGKNQSPTIRGIFEIQERGVWFYSNRLKSGAKYWVRFNGAYLFHSIPMDKYKNVIDGTLGEKSSSGCVRMSIEDAKWFYNNVSDGTRVFIN